MLTLLSFFALAAPPTNPDPRLAPWFRSLTRPWEPGSSMRISCCTVADCRVTDYRTIAGGYEVLIDERFPSVYARSWQRVPQVAILEHKDNPTGGAVVCWNGLVVVCFVRPEEG
jgi:hypothetical protein